MSNETQNVTCSPQESLNGQLPLEVAKKFNWGAFLLSWIWGIGNNSYLTLISLASVLFVFIPLIGGFVPLGLCIWFGIKGNEWAWQNKKWENVEQFENVQRTWAKAGVIVMIIGFVLCILFGILAAILGIAVAGLAK